MSYEISAKVPAVMDSSTLCSDCNKQKLDSDSICTWCREGVLVPSTPSKEKQPGQNPPQVPVEVAPCAAVRHQPCSVCNEVILAPSSGHSLCATCVASLGDDNFDHTVDDVITRTPTPTRVAPQSSYVGAVLTQESGTQSFAPGEMEHEPAPGFARRRLSFDGCDHDAVISLELPNKVVRDKLVEACKTQSTIQLAVRIRRSTPSYDFPEAIILVDVVSSQEGAPTYTRPSAPSMKSKVCIVCSKSIEPWMTRCVPCYAAWQREVNPSQGSGICKLCNGATELDWHNCCNLCFSKERDEEHRGQPPSINHNASARCLPVNEEPKSRVRPRDPPPPLPAIRQVYTCVKCGGPTKEHWMTHCGVCYGSQAQAKRQKLS